MQNKLGLLKPEEADKKLIQSLLRIMEDSGADMTNTFRNLSRINISDKSSIHPVLEYILTQVLTVPEWAAKSKPEVSSEDLMKMVQIAQRNHMMLHYLTGRSPEWLVQQIQKSKEYDNMLHTKPEEKLEKDKLLWSEWLNNYFERLSHEVTGLSEEEIEEAQASRVVLMNKNNPKFVLRNYMAQKSIEDAEKGNYEEVDRLLKLLKNPYGEGTEFLLYGYDKKAPESALSICVTCSS